MVGLTFCDVRFLPGFTTLPSGASAKSWTWAEASVAFRACGPWRCTHFATDGTPFAPTDLVDCNLANGEAAYGIFDPGPCVGGVCLTANKNQLSVISQPENVKFGLAAVFGVTDIDVRGEATVEIKTPLQKTLPLYAHSGCDYGSQTIKQPTNGQSSDGITLANSSDSNTYVIEADGKKFRTIASAQLETANELMFERLKMEIAQ